MTPADLAELIRERQPCVVLTGAGVSTESGIPDFRSAGGIWASYDPMEVASIAGFRRDPVRVWEFYARRLAVLEEAEPNDAHRALARLEELGLVEAIVTQNVDGLHHRSGLDDDMVAELHGNVRESHCLDCDGTWPTEEVLGWVEAGALWGAGDCAGGGGAWQPSPVHERKCSAPDRRLHDRSVILGNRNAGSDAHAAAGISSIGVARYAALHANVVLVAPTA